MINAISFLAVLASLRLIRTDELTPVTRRPTRVLPGIREGISWAAHAPITRTVLIVVTVVSTVGFNFHVLVPLLASQTLEVDAEMFGILSAVFGLGALGGALATATLREASPRVFLAGGVGFSLAMLALALAHSVAAALALLFALGISFSLLTASANALVQLAAPTHLRGRVIGLYMFAFAGLAPVGGLVAGWLAEQGGTPLAFGVAGVAGLATAAWASRELGIARAPAAAAPSDA